MKNTFILGIVLLALGVIFLGYRAITYQTRETVLEVGPIKATAERTRSIPLPPAVGWALVISGTALLAVSPRAKSSS